jgi:hypothetical protein
VATCIRCLIGGFAAVVAMAASQPAAAAFIDVRSNWSIFVNLGGPPIPPGLTCNGEVDFSECGGDFLTVNNFGSDSQSSTSSTLTNTGPDPVEFDLQFFFSAFNPGGPEVGLSIDNTRQSASFSSLVSIDFGGSPFLGYTVVCSLPGIPGTEGDGNSFLFSATECGVRSPDETDPNFRGFFLLPGESVVFDGTLAISSTFADAPAPEPSVLGLLTPALLALGLLRRRRIAAPDAPASP